MQLKKIKLFGFLVAAALIGFMGVLQVSRASLQRWDNQIKEMCEEEGGVVINQTVFLTREEFEAYGPIQGVIPIPLEAASHLYELPYFNRRTTTVINESRPRVEKFESLILRKSDAREMASSVSFGRISEDSWLGIRYDSGFGCASVEGFSANISPQLFEIAGN